MTQEEFSLNGSSANDGFTPIEGGEPKSAITAPPPVETFGEPNRGDATAGIERMAVDAAEESKARMETMMPEVINRAPGSRPISKEDQFKEWQAMILDEKALRERFEGLSGMQSIGPERAELMMRRWDAQHREKIK